LSRIVWWCYPRFDGDPIFSRLLAGDEEKGFCDVVLEGMVEFSSDPRFLRTVQAIERELLRDNHVMRYASEDDFGLTETAFLACRFWLIDVLWDLGRREQARDMFNDALKYRNRYGLLTEDVHPLTGELWGNFPQTYSMAGLILTATRLSRSWEDRVWRA
jgi:GH15 family glucan-1,4-alpha-glucosidase